MRITGRELRRVINEEVRRSMRSSLLREGDGSPEGVSLEMQKAAGDASQTRSIGGQKIMLIGSSLIGNFMQECSDVSKFIERVIASSQTMRENAIGLRQGMFDISTKGSQSMRARAVKNVLTEFAGQTSTDGLVRAVLAAIKTGKSYFGPSFESIDADLGMGPSGRLLGTIEALEDIIKYEGKNFIEVMKMITSYDIIEAVRVAGG